MTTKFVKPFIDIFILTSFLFGIIYILDDLARVIPVKGLLEDIVLYGFFSSVPFAFALSVFGFIKWRETRFKFYVAVTSIQLLLCLLLIYIVMNSQV